MDRMRAGAGLMAIAVMCGAGGIAAPAGCSRDTKVKYEDPIADVQNPRLPEKKRVESITKAWQDAQAGKIDRTNVREELKRPAWGADYPLAMRMEAWRLLASDTTEAGREDNHKVAKLILPREPNHQVTAFVSNLAVSNGWTDTTPALMRSLSRQWPETPDVQRPEYKAIQALNPGKGVDEVVYDVFLNPPEEMEIFGVVPESKVRADAWDLLARIDPSGQSRARLVMDGDASKSGPVADMRASLADLRCLPLTGDELTWLSQLHDFKDPVNRLWWQETAAAVAMLDVQRVSKLQLRHLEPVRWAARHRREWLNASREELLSQVRQMLEGRSFDRRRARDTEKWRPSPERLRDWEGKLSWADCLTILVIDGAIHDRAVVQTLFAQAQMDREDKTAEYGGVLRVDDLSEASRPAEVVMYPPRAGQRQGDKQFIASTDMINQSAHALAHYHFHVQEPRNSEYAGPSANDLVYAGRFGRSCLVFTSVGESTIDADYYQPDGIVIDLGEIAQ